MSNSKGEQEEKLADKCLNQFGWFGITTQTNTENAVEHYIKAAALFKISKDFESSGRCYEKASKANLELKNEIEAVQNYKNAGKMYIHVNPKKAMEMYKYAIQFYLEANKFSQAAKLQEQIGDMLLEENNVEDAIIAYEECADLFKTENEINQMNKRLLKVAELSAKLGRYERCIQIFESVANHNVDNNLLRWNVKTLLFKGMICQINNYITKKNSEDDNIEKPTMNELEDAFKKYCDLSDLYASSREAELIDNILKSMKNNDLDSFKQQLIRYDKISKLDPWCTEQLLVIQRYIDDKLNPIDPLNDDDISNINDDKKKEEPSGGFNPFDLDPEVDLDNAPLL